MHFASGILGERSWIADNGCILSLYRIYSNEYQFSECLVLISFPVNVSRSDRSVTRDRDDCPWNEHDELLLKIAKSNEDALSGFDEVAMFFTK